MSVGLQCPRLDPPVNGALACDYWLYGQFCQMFCQKGMDIAHGMKGRIPKILVCHKEGSWSSGPLKNGKLPPCTSKQWFLIVNNGTAVGAFTH